MLRLLGFRNCSCVFRSSGISGAPAHPQPKIRGGPASSKIFIGPPGGGGGVNSTKNKRGSGPSPSSASDVVMNNIFFSISYQIMLDCWRENPVDRPTFERLRNTMKEMERNHKVRRVRTFSKREKQLWIRKVYLGRKLMIIPGLKLREVCVAPPSRPLIPV